MQANVSTIAFDLADIKKTAVLEINTGFLKKLFLTRPLFGLDLITCLFIIVFSFLLNKIIKSIEKETAFKTMTYKLLYWMSACFFLYGILSGLITYFTNKYVQDLTDQKYSLKWNLLNTCIPGLLAYISFSFGYVFKKGNLLQQEQDLTV